MLRTIRCGRWGVGLLVLALSLTSAAQEKIIIAHRGACGYLPEHTLAAVTLAFAQGADYIEQDVVMTRDDAVIVLHDLYLDATTDVAEKFPGRQQSDGHFYAIDFTLAEIRQLTVHERMDLQTGQAALPQRFSPRKSRFVVPTLAEEIELIQELNRQFGKTTGIYVEIKAPGWHRARGKDLTAATLAILENLGYRHQSDPVYIQCFEPGALQRLRSEFHCELKRIQLIEEAGAGNPAVDYGQMHTESGLREIATYADGIGPSARDIVTGLEANGQPLVTPLVQMAHAAGLKVHPYTFRADQLPPGIGSFEDLLRLFLFRIGVDGVFTDHPDRAVAVLRGE